MLAVVSTSAWAGVTVTVSPDRIDPGGRATVTVDLDITAAPPNRPPNYTPGEEPMFTVDLRPVAGKPTGELVPGSATGDAEWIHGTRFRALPKRGDTRWRAVAKVQLQFQAARRRERSSSSGSSMRTAASIPAGDRHCRSCPRRAGGHAGL